MRSTLARRIATSALRQAPAGSGGSSGSSSGSGSGSSNLPAGPLDSSSGPLQRAASSILPPLPLYRRLLRAHRLHLTYEMRSLGDSYIKDEFRRHRAVTNPLQIVGFLGAWKIYLDQLEATGKDGGGVAGDGEATGSTAKNGRYFQGRSMSPEEFEKLSDEQLYQLHDFMTAAQELYDPPDPAKQAEIEAARAAGQPVPGEKQPEAQRGEGDQVFKDILDSSSKGRQQS